MSDFGTISSLQTIPTPEDDGSFAKRKARSWRETVGGQPSVQSEPRLETSGKVLPPTSVTPVTHPSDQSLPALTSEQANALFPVENYGAYTAGELHHANLENFREGERLHGKFTAHLYDRVLPGINESIKRLKNGIEINGFSGERQVGAYLESIGYTADLVRQWNKRYRERMAKLKKTLGLTDGNADANLTPEQRELRDTLIQQGYKSPEATRLAKAAEGNSVTERFNWVMAQRASEISGSGTNTTANDPNSEPAPEATETSTAAERGGVTTVTDADAGELDGEDTAAFQLKGALANEPDQDIASELITKHLLVYARQQFGNEQINIKEVSAKVAFAGRDCRIMPGDFLERRDKDGAILSKCVGVAEFMKRRRVQEWREGKWQKDRVISSEHETEFRVITEEKARLLVPEAFPPSQANPSEGL